jgi:hypothetical protein
MPATRLEVLESPTPVSSGDERLIYLGCQQV